MSFASSSSLLSLYVLLSRLMSCHSLVVWPLWTGVELRRARLSAGHSSANASASAKARDGPHQGSSVCGDRFSFRARFPFRFQFRARTASASSPASSLPPNYCHYQTISLRVCFFMCPRTMKQGDEKGVERGSERERERELFGSPGRTSSSSSPATTTIHNEISYSVRSRRATLGFTLSGPPLSSG